MAKNITQQQKLLYLQKFFYEFTDENHGVTINEIINYLNEHDISAERKSIYGDIKTLQEFGMDIIKCKSKTVTYKLLSRDFELPELKLLVDAVQSSKFITEKKSLELIKKVENLASQYEGKLLQRQVVVSNRIKTMNEKIYYNTDTIYNAIDAGKKITFEYYQWSLNFGSNQKVIKTKRKDGEIYKISPWALTWDDENYYLIAYDDVDQKIKHYRVDKMDKIQISNENRDGHTVFKKFNLATYSKRVFGMFGGEEVTVKLMFSNNLIGVVMDRLGSDVYISKADDNSFFVTATVNLSPQFYGWLFGFGNGVKIVAPKKVADEYTQRIQSVATLYSHKK
ncbi:MAG: WYL domain-containing protein [Oscillospiraceae bacterium]|nr:WYL domain-containing protein [Oscillospiraceae bacterium]